MNSKERDIMCLYTGTLPCGIYKGVKIKSVTENFHMPNVGMEMEKSQLRAYIALTWIKSRDGNNHCVSLACDSTIF